MKGYTIFKKRLLEDDDEIREHIAKIYYKTGSDDYIWIKRTMEDNNWPIGWDAYRIDEDGKINLNAEHMVPGMFWMRIKELSVPFVRIFPEEGYFAELCVDIDERDPITHLSITDTPITKDWRGDTEDLDYPIGLDTFDPTDFVGKYISDYYGDPSDDDQVPEEDGLNEEQPEKDPRDMNTGELKSEIQKAIERVSSICKDVEAINDKLLDSEDKLDDSDMRSWTDDEVELLIKSSELEGFIAGIALTLTVVGVTKGIKKLLRK